eukprot:4835287-Alexandrium_andersonii.AAC.1
MTGGLSAGSSMSCAATEQEREGAKGPRRRKLEAEGLETEVLDAPNPPVGHGLRRRGQQRARPAREGRAAHALLNRFGG